MLEQKSPAASLFRQTLVYPADLMLPTCKLTPSGALSSSRLTMSRNAFWLSSSRSFMNLHMRWPGIRICRHAGRCC